MGWLRELMLEASPPVRSFGELARQALASEEWTDPSRPQARSLAALFSKFDRGLELEWLSDRQSVQYALAAGLRCPVATIANALRGQGAVQDHAQRRWRFYEARYARPLDLTQEPLPPSLPAAVGDPASWEHCWWYAPPGAGSSLAGAWLGARGLACQLRAETWEEALPLLPAHGPVFLRLRCPTATRIVPPARRALCVAAPFLPEPARGSAAATVEPRGAVSGWRLLRSDPIARWLDPFVSWLAERLPSDGHFNSELARDWLRQAAQAGVAHDFRTALGLAGLIDELGVQQVRGKDLDALAAQYVGARVREATAKAEHDPGVLLKSGYDVLVGMLVRGLTESEDPLTRYRTQEQWLSLVPEELQRNIDAEWVRVSLASSGAPTTVRDLEKALSTLPPGGYRVVRTLIAATLLQAEQDHQEDGLFALTPSWLHRAATVRAVDRLAADTPAQWGEGMLRPAAAARIFGRLMSKARDGDLDFCEQVLDADEAQTPGECMAVETAFRIVGALLLEGHEPPPEIVSGMWEAQRPLMIFAEQATPVPRFGHPQQTSEQEPLLSLGAWYLASWAISEQLPEASPELAALTPWHYDSDGAAPGQNSGLPGVLDAIDRTLAQLPAPAFASQAYELLDRAYDGLPREPSVSSHPLFVPSEIVRLVENQELHWQQVSTLGSEGRGLDALYRLVHLRQLPWARVARAIWDAWQHAGLPEAQAFLTQPTEPQAGLWPHVPPELLALMLEGGHVEPSVVPFEQLLSSHWRVLALGWTTLRAKLPIALAAELGASGVAEALIEHATLTAEDVQVLQQLWLHHPLRCLDACQRWLDEAQLTRLSLFLQAAPAEHTRSLVQALRRATLRREARPEQQRLAIGWLHQRVTERRHTWREAYTLLEELQERQTPWLPR